MNPKVHYEIHAVLSEYAGNHERMLTEWIFGMTDDYTNPSMDRPHAEEMEWAGGGEMEGTLITTPHDEYGAVWQHIGDDPEWYEIARLTRPGENINGRLVWWTLEEPPTEEQWKAFKRAFESNPKGITAERLSVKEVVTTYRDLTFWSS